MPNGEPPSPATTDEDFPDPAEHLVHDEPMVKPSSGDAGEAGEEPETTPTAGPGSPDDADPTLSNGERLLTSTHVVVTTPRHRIEKRAPILWTVEGIWTWLCLGGLQIGWFYWNDHSMGFWNWVALWLTVPLAALNIVIAPWWRYLVARWDVSETAICARHGWWTTHFRIAPISRLQTVYTTRNFFERILGLSTVIAATASAQGNVSVRGLSVPDADALSEYLINVAQLDAGDAT